MRAFPAASCTDRCSVAATFSSSKITGLCSFARFSCLQFLLENLHQFFDVPDPSCARLSCHLPFAKIAACRQAARYFEKFFHVSADDLLWFSEPSFKNLYCRNVVIVGQLQTLDSTRNWAIEKRLQVIELVDIRNRCIRMYRRYRTNPKRHSSW